jgi:hypothetical protein
VYRIEHLNPMSSYHLSMKVSYPNAFDRRMAARDRRTNLGGDIFIHGKSVSIGCVASAIARSRSCSRSSRRRHAKVKVIIAPNDLRVAGRCSTTRRRRGSATLFDRRRGARGVPGVDGIGQLHRCARNPTFKIRKVPPK